MSYSLFTRALSGNWRSCYNYFLSCRQSAAVLEAESGYVFESDMVAQFRQSVLQGEWDAVEQVLEDMGVHGDAQLRVCAPSKVLPLSLLDLLC